MKLYFGKRIPVVISSFYTECERRVGVGFGGLFVGVVWSRTVTAHGICIMLELIMNGKSVNGLDAKNWAMIGHGTANTPTAVFVLKTDADGTVWFLKPNPWALLAGDRRAGWTRPMRGGPRLRMPVDPDYVRRVVAAIGPPPEMPG